MRDARAANASVLRRGDACGRVLEDDDALGRSILGDSERAQSVEVAFRMRLALRSVFRGDDERDAISDAHHAERVLDLVAKRAGHDADRSALGATANEIDGTVEDLELVRDAAHVDGL